MNLPSAVLALLVTVDASPTKAPPSPPTSPPAAAATPTANAPPAAAPAPPTLPAQLARIDELHKRREDRSAWAEEQRLVQATVARAPQDYGALWRAARFYFWLSDDPGVTSDQRSRWGKEGWDLAERAITANPNDPAGYYFAAVCMGNYSLGLGIMKALTMGMEGKFRDRLGHAQKLNPTFEHGAIEIAWGRFFAKLPWPKRDRPKSEEHLRRALQIHPPNLRARLYLAMTYLDDDRPKDAKPLLDEVNAAPVGRYDTAEERRAKAIATTLMPELQAKLK